MVLSAIYLFHAMLLTLPSPRYYTNWTRLLLTCLLPLLALVGLNTRIFLGIRSNIYHYIFGGTENQDICGYLSFTLMPQHQDMPRLIKQFT